MLRRGAGIWCGGVVLVLAMVLLTGRDPGEVMREVMGSSPNADVSLPRPAPGGVPEAPGDQLGRFASVVLADTEETWHTLLDSARGRYVEPRLVLFSDAVESACGIASAGVGPFYCPVDQQLYLDLRFFDLLARRLGAPGDFAQAYVIAHEVGHHVQNLLGLADEVRRVQQQVSQEEANTLQVRMELQADCFAGVWGHHAARKGLLEEGDLEEGRNAAGAIGDDQMQSRMQGYVVPESFTHGTSEQRMRWFEHGLRAGEPNACETFR